MACCSSATLRNASLRWLLLHLGSHPAIEVLTFPVESPVPSVQVCCGRFSSTFMAASSSGEDVSTPSRIFAFGSGFFSFPSSPGSSGDEAPGHRKHREDAPHTRLGSAAGEHTVNLSPSSAISFAKSYNIHVHVPFLTSSCFIVQVGPGDHLPLTLSRARPLSVNENLCIPCKPYFHGCHLAFFLSRIKNLYSIKT